MYSGANLLLLTLEEATEQLNQRVGQVDRGDVRDTEKYEFRVRAALRKFGHDIFERGIPLYGEDKVQKIKLSCSLQDNTNILENVTLWDNPARDILGLNGADLAELWYACDSEDAEENKEALLEALNVNANKSFQLICAASVRRWGSGPLSLRNVQVSIDAVVQ